MGEDVIHSFLKRKKIKYTKCLSGSKKSIRDKGGEKELVMFLSGMGGTEKSEVIRAFVLPKE